jgi:hypothetical protein
MSQLSLGPVPEITRHPARGAVAIAVAALLLSGCLSVRSRQAAGRPGEGGGVSLTLYADDGARRANVPGPSGVTSELSCWQEGQWKPVFRSLQPTWTVIGLPGGRCRIAFPARFDAAGHLQRLDERSRTVRVRDGETTEVVATLRHVSKPLVVAGVTAGVVAAVLLHEWLGDHDLPTPPLPEPSWWLADLAAQVVIDLALAPRAVVSGPYGPGPVVSGHFPAHREVVDAGPLEVVYSLAQPLALERLASGGVTVHDARGERVSGYLQYDAEQWWLVWRPDEPLPPGGTFHVTLAADAVRDVHGRGFPAPVAFTFHTR